MNTQTYTRTHTNTHIYTQMRTQRERERDKSREKAHHFPGFSFSTETIQQIGREPLFCFVFYSSSHDTSDFHVFQSWGLGYDQDTLTIHSKDAVVTQDRVELLAQRPRQLQATLHRKSPFV